MGLCEAVSCCGNAVHFIIAKNSPGAASLCHWNAGVADLFRGISFVLAKIKQDGEIQTVKKCHKFPLFPLLTLSLG